jgi:A/G-specific adenine glycosylase
MQGEAFIQYGMELKPKNILKFLKMIFTWWKTNKRDLPWRRTRDPYKIAVSEVMLQQTQVLRVIAKYREFIQRYPTINDLAHASAADVLRIWKGMGYNRRALYLHRMAKEIVSNYNSRFPVSEQLLSKLPGLGKYTARAILVFAYEENIACVDTNIRQIIIHYFFQNKPQKEGVIQSAADQLLPDGKSWEWHQALMDYGSVYNSDIKVQNSELKHKTVPFKKSNRYIRGRILDMVRENVWKEKELVKLVREKYRKSDSAVNTIVSGLLKDGLIIKRSESISLPE